VHKVDQISQCRPRATAEVTDPIDAQLLASSAINSSGITPPRSHRPVLWTRLPGCARPKPHWRKRHEKAVMSLMPLCRTTSWEWVDTSKHFKEF
jgi:hypothetical protein